MATIAEPQKKNGAIKSREDQMDSGLFVVRFMDFPGEGYDEV
jgi:hypothetical protein